MFKKTSLQDWESVVQKQMKTENIYEILSKENLEGIVVKPYYDSVPTPLNNLPRVEESTHLVSLYHESAEENVFAFLLNKNVEDLQEKVLFVNFFLKIFLQKIKLVNSINSWQKNYWRKTLKEIFV